MDWPTYLATLSTNQSEIARAADVHSGTVSRWFSRSSQPLATQVIAVARAFDQSPVLALLAAGYLTRAEVEQEVELSPGMSLAEFSELDIAQELVRRIEAGETTKTTNAPLEVDHPAWATNVGGSQDDQSTDGEGLTVRDSSGEAIAVVTAIGPWQPERVLESLMDHISRMPHAAKSEAVEIEEDLHQP